MATLGHVGAQTLKTPATIYKQGKLTRENTRALGQLLMMATMAYGVYPALDKAVQTVSGQPDATMNRRGISQVTHAVSQVVQGKKPIRTLVPNVASPSIPLNMVMQGAQQRDWQGKDITQQGSPLPEQAEQEADWAASQAIPPVGDLGQGLREGNPLGHFAAGEVGAHIPSVAESKYLANQDKILRRGVKQHDKKQGGVLDQAYHYVREKL